MPSKKDIFQDFVQIVEPEVHTLKDDGIYPNNAKLPLLFYKQVLKLPSYDPATIIEKLFESNEWNGCWRNGIYGFHHYHSTAHEVLGVYSGHVKVKLGGDKGITVSMQCGDIVIIPAGVAHKNLESSPDFRVVGAYPLGQSWDMCYGKPGERPKADQNIASVALPKSDPVCGKTGPLVIHWLQ